MSTFTSVSHHPKPSNFARPDDVLDPPSHHSFMASGLSLERLDLTAASSARPWKFSGIDHVADEGQALEHWLQSDPFMIHSAGDIS
jgi:hypothetical protein